MSAREAVHFDPAPDAPGKVRRLVERATINVPAEVAEDVKLVAVELVTNAWLHAHGGADITVMVTGNGVRVEVTDTGHALPVVRAESADVVFGRGLHLIAGLTSGWGVHPDGNRKTVWAEVPFDRSMVGRSFPEVNTAALIASWMDEVDVSPSNEVQAPRTIRVAGVSTRHMVRAQAHIADVTREMHLLLAGELAGGRPVPAVLTQAVETLSFDWGGEVERLRQQVASATARGVPEIDVELRYSAISAGAVERWDEALEITDALSRAGRLLTPPSSPQDVVFRRWWLGSLSAQLRAAADGGPPPSAQRFADELADSYDQLTVRAAAWDRLQLLQKVTGDLTDARTVEEIARIVVDNAYEQFDATSARVYLLDDDRMLRSVAWNGDAVRELPDPYDVVSLDSDLPGAMVARTRTPLVMRDLVEIYRTFPALNGFYPEQRALLIHPITAGERLIGLLGLTFQSARFDESEHVPFVQALANALAQALDRAQALAAAEMRADRLRLLADASLALNVSLDLHDAVNALTRLLVPRIADWALVEVLRDGRLETAGVYHADPAKLASAWSLEGRWPTDMDALQGRPAVLRSRRSEVFVDIPDELLEAGAVDTEHLADLRALGIRSAAVVPLTGRWGPVGVVTLLYAESQRRYRDDDLPMLEDIARRAAFAIEAAQTFREQSGRLADVVRVADAAQRAILADVPARVGPFLLAAVYRSSAAEATIGGDLFDVVPWRDGVRLLIGDVRGKGLGAIRTASLVLGAARSAAEDLDDPADVIATVDRRLRRHLGDEDFVTACLVELAANGNFRVALAGHPAPFVIHPDGRIAQVEVSPGPPLGLGTRPETAAGALAVGDRLLLFTDALTESRDASRAFIPVERIVPWMAGGTLHAAVAATLSELNQEAVTLDDDLALLAVEHAIPMSVAAQPLVTRAATQRQAFRDRQPGPI